MPAEHELRPIDVSDPVRTMLRHLRAIEGTELPPELSEQAVRDVEAALDCHLHDDVLAAMAAQTDQLGDLLDMALDKLVAHTRAARTRGASGDWIAIGRHPDGHAYYCVERAPQPGVELRLYELDAFDGSVGWMEFVDWLESQFVMADERLSDDDGKEFAGWLEQQLVEDDDKDGDDADRAEAEDAEEGSDALPPFHPVLRLTRAR
jgi:plasmid stabilization system protein ParE